jgi:hypothetical protein
MSQNAPFTDEEYKLFCKVTSLFNDFNNLLQTYNHPSDKGTYVSAIHELQNLIVLRCARRQWPKTLLSFNKKEDL